MEFNGHKGGDGFPTTHWSFVQQAGAGGSENDAFVRFLERYLPALRTYLVRVQRLTPESADDLLQEFVLEKVIRQQLVSHADQRRGRFRTFLLSVLNNFLTTHRRKQMAAKRSPGKPLVSLEEAAVQVTCGSAVADAFDREWAKQVLAETLQCFEAECRESNRADLWGVFEERVLAPMRDDVEPPPYEQLVDRLGFQSPLQASNALTTAKRRFAKHLRIVIGEYAQDEREIQDEIRHLRQILATPQAQ